MSTPAPAVAFRGPGEGETITDRPARTVRILCDLDELVVTLFRHEPGESGPQPHVHRHHADAFYVLSGEWEFRLGPDVTAFSGGPGTFVAAPPNLVHTFASGGDRTATLLNFHAPSVGFGDYLRGRAETPFDQEDPPADGGRPLEDAIFRPAGDGELLPRAYGSVLVKGELAQLSALEFEFEREWEGVSPHTHDSHVDAFYVLDGAVDFLLAEGVRRATTGAFVAAPPGSLHGFETNAGPARLLNLHAPDAGFAARVRES